MKIAPPNYTQTPNDLFDHWLPHLNESELKVLLIIIRKTFGFHKERDRISLSQIEKFTGLTRANVCKGINSLESKGVIHKEILGILGQEQVYYSLVVSEDSNKSDQYSCDTPPSIDPIPPPVFLKYPQKKPPKETPTKTVCTGAQPEKNSVSVGSEPQFINQSCKKQHPDGYEYEVKLDDILTESIRRKDGFKLEEFHEAWQALTETNQPIRNPYLYLIGTIKKIRNTKSFKHSTKEKKCQESQLQPQKMNKKSEPRKLVCLGDVMKERASQKCNSMNIQAPDSAPS